MLLGDFLAGEPLREARGHGFEFGHRGAAQGGVARAVLHDDLLHEVGALEDDAAARVLRAEVAEVLEKCGVAHRGEDAALVADVFRGELDDGAGLDVAARADVMRDAVAHRAERLAAVIVVGVNHRDGHLCAHLDDEAAHAHELIRAQRERGIHLRADGAVGVIPHVMRADFDQLAQPFLGAEFVNVRLAHARGDAGEDALAQAVLQAAHGAREDFLFSPPLVAHDFAALDAHERRGVADLPQALRDFLGDELAVREDLKVAVRVRREEVEQLRVHERLAAEDAEERVPVRLRVGDGAVQRVEIDLRALGLDIHPAALAAQVAGVQDREVEEGRKIFTALDAALEFLDREQPLHAEIPHELSKQPRVGRAEDAEGELWKHGAK